MSDTILLVEDNANDIELVRLMLMKERIMNPLDVERTGPDAERYLFGGYKELPRMVLLDLNIVGYDGLHILHQMRVARPTHDIPVLVLTGSGDDEAMLKSVAGGANSFIRKPLTLLSLSVAVKAVGMGFLIVKGEV